MLLSVRECPPPSFYPRGRRANSAPRSSPPLARVMEWRSVGACHAERSSGVSGAVVWACSGGGVAMARARTADHAFGTRDPFSVGAEEELFLVDPVSGRMVNSSAAVTERLAPALAGVERELHAGMVEFISDVCSSAHEVTGQLAQRRAACLGTGVGLLGYPGPTRRRRRTRPESRIRNATSGSIIFWGTPWQPRWLGFTCTWGCLIPTRRSRSSTRCGSTFRFSRGSRRTRHFVMDGTPAWPRPAASPSGAGPDLGFRGRCGDSRISVLRRSF